MKIDEHGRGDSVMFFIRPHKMAVNVQAKGEAYAIPNGQSNIHNPIR